MHKWNLAPGQPMCLGLAADSRFSQITPNNDHIWEIKLGGTEPLAMSLQTTYGLRARNMRLFPRFSHENKTISDPLQFHHPPELEKFYPNYLAFNCLPFSGIKVKLEYWVPESNAACGKISISNHNDMRETMDMEWICILNPLGEGQNMGPVQMAMTHVLQGKTSNLSPVFFLTGGPNPSKGAFPGLSVQIDLQPGGERTLYWALVSLSNSENSLEKARRLTARAWEAELARLELQNSADTIDISTGDIEWDAAFAMSQKTANSLFISGNEKFPRQSFVLSRQPDHGYSQIIDGSDHTFLWSGQTALDTYFLANALPAQQERLRSLLRNFLATADDNGNIEWRVSLFLPPTRQLAQPVLCTLAWKLAGSEKDMSWLEEVYPLLLKFFRAWFMPSNDRDEDGFPEWSHPIQTGLEDAPIYDRWHGGQSIDTTFIEAPGLAAFLYMEARNLINIAERIGITDDVPLLQKSADNLRMAVQSTWDNNLFTYHYRDATTHLAPTGERIVSFTGSGKTRVSFKFQHPHRLILYLNVPLESTRNIQVKIHGQTRKGFATEIINTRQWSWTEKQAAATSQNAYIAVRQIEIIGLPPEGIGWLSTCDFSIEDCSLLLPLWAGIPTNEQAKQIIRSTLFNRYLGQYGIPISPSDETSSTRFVPMNYNLLLAEGVLRYGMRRQAADLFTRWMQAIIPNLRQSLSFRSAFDATTGQASGENNALRGLIPLDLFLKILGIKVLQTNKVILEGNNPFPRPIAVKYYGMTITRYAENSVVSFPNGQTVEVKDDQPHVIIL